MLTWLGGYPQARALFKPAAFLRTAAGSSGYVKRI